MVKITDKNSKQSIVSWVREKGGGSAMGRGGGGRGVVTHGERGATDTNRGGEGLWRDGHTCREGVSRS